MNDLQIRYNWLARLCLKNEEKIHLLKRLRINFSRAKNPSFFNVESSVLFSWESHEVELMIEAAN